jgi:hypothetical protein
LSYERLSDTVYQSFKKRPTCAQLSAIFQDYQNNFLLFVYEAPDGSIWGQWITSDKFLPKFKTQADRNSPAPDADAVKAYMDRYISNRKTKYLSFQSFHKSSKISENVQNISEDFPLGVGVGEGVGEGKNTLPDGRESANADQPAIRPEEFANAWNAERGPLPKITAFTPSRRKKTQVRIHAGLTLETFREAVLRCRGVPFLSGDNNRGWRADYDWLMANDTNIARVLEGKYDGSGGNGNGTATANRAQERVDGTRGAFRKAAERRGIRGVDGFAGPDGPGVSASAAHGGNGGGMAGGNRTPGGPVRGGESADGAGGFSSDAGPEILPPS